MAAASYEDSVFINCPFDPEYQAIFRAIAFTVHDCGFLARCALEVDDSGEVRIAKINRIIRECRHGIHDISRTELDRVENLPRFNMPLELGLFLGAREFGTGKQKQKRALILDIERYRFQKFCSDISGQDIKAHEGSADKAIRAIRNWLATTLDGSVLLPSAGKVVDRYSAFQADLPGICAPLHLDPDDLQFVELRTLVEEWVDQNRP
ncbi:MAG TPA: hypothetical protein VEQ60_05185 [Longimicrobium sp.]|nr:hypothetical protein [Longimicrobium sp.]